MTKSEVATERGARIGNLYLKATVPMLCCASLVCFVIHVVCRGFSRTVLGKG